MSWPIRKVLVCCLAVVLGLAVGIGGQVTTGAPTPEVHAAALTCGTSAIGYLSHDCTDVGAWVQYYVTIDECDPPVSGTIYLSGGGAGPFALTDRGSYWDATICVPNGTSTIYAIAFSGSWTSTTMTVTKIACGCEH